MNVWYRIMIFFPLWLVFSAIYYGIVFLVFPESFSGSKTEFDILISNNFYFLLFSQLAILMGTFTAIIFVSKLLLNEKPTFLKSMLKLDGLFHGILIGVISIVLIILILNYISPINVKFQGLNYDILWYILIFFVASISEESMVRGFIFSHLYSKINKLFAVLVTSIIFVIIHVLNSSLSLIGIINIFLGGVLLALLYLKNMNLSIPIGFHFSWNFFQGPIFGFSVSGFVTKGIFKITKASGADFSFRDFGLEGSLLSTIVLSLFVLYFYILHIRKLIKPNTDPSMNESKVAKTKLIRIETEA